MAEEAPPPEAPKRPIDDEMRERLRAAEAPKSQKKGEKFGHFPKRGGGKGGGGGGPLTAIEDIVGFFLGFFLFLFKGFSSAAGTAVRFKRYLLVLLLLSVIGGATAAVVVFILPNIPLQMERSAAFTAFEESRYQDARGKFKAYLRKKPDDYEAAYYAVKAALKLGDYTVAARAVQKIRNIRSLAEDPQFLFEYALLVVDEQQDQSLATLNSLLTIQPDHAGGRLLRGVLMGARGEFRAAREDFLRADEIVRGAQKEDANIPFLYRYLHEKDLFARTYDLPPGEADADIQARFQDAFGFPMTLEGFVNRYYSQLEENETLPARTIIGLQYAYLLLSQEEEINAARAEWRAMGNDGSLAKRNLEALILLHEGDWNAAAARYEELAADSSSARLLLNRANSRFSAEPSLAAVAGARENFSKVVALRVDDAVARNNLAVMDIIDGDYKKAKKHLKSISPEESPPQAIFNLALTESQERKFEAVEELLARLPESMFAGSKQYMRYQALSEKGDIEGSLSLLDDSIHANGGRQAVPILLRARLLRKLRLPMRAMWTLKKAVEPALSNSDLQYLIGATAIDLGDLPAAKKARQAMDIDPPPPQALALDTGILALQGDGDASAAAFRQALQQARSEEEKARYIADWWQLLENNGHGDAINAGGELSTDIVEIAALFARLIAADSPEYAEILARGALGEDPSPFVLRHAGAALSVIGQHKEALRTLEEARQWTPADKFLLDDLRQAQLRAGKKKEAEKTAKVIDYLAAKESGQWTPVGNVKYDISLPENKELSALLSKIIAGEESPKAALSMYATLIGAAAGDRRRTGRLLFDRATFYLALGRHEKAVDDLQKAVTAGRLQSERYATALAYLGGILVLQKKPAQALPAYKRLVSVAPDEPLYARLYATALKEANHRTQAIQILLNSLARHPAEVESRLELANLYHQDNRREETIMVLRQAIRTRPLFAPAYQRIAAAQSATGDKATAAENNAIYQQLK